MDKGSVRGSFDLIIGLHFLSDLLGVHNNCSLHILRRETAQTEKAKRLTAGINQIK